MCVFLYVEYRCFIPFFRGGGGGGGVRKLNTGVKIFEL